MSTSRVAKRYAKSLVTLAQEQGTLDTIKDEMITVRDTCKSSRDLRMMLKSPIVTNDKKLRVLKALFGKSASKLTNRFYEVLSQKNREAVLPEIAVEFIRQYNDIKGIQVAEVTTSFSIDKALREQFIEIVKEITGKKSVELIEKVDKDILGGFLLSVGDRQYDDTITSKLKKLKYQLLNHA